MATSPLCAPFATPWLLRLRLLRPIEKLFAALVKQRSLQQLGWECCASHVVHGLRVGRHAGGMLFAAVRKCSGTLTGLLHAAAKALHAASRI